MLLDQATTATKTATAELVKAPAMYSPQDIRRRARTKIVATVGPASSSPEQLKMLALAGVDVFRFYMVDAEPESAARYTSTTIRRLSEEIGEPIAILVDLAGPKIRLGETGRTTASSVRLERRVPRSSPATTTNGPNRADSDLRTARERALGRRPRDARRRHGGHVSGAERGRPRGREGGAAGDDP